MTILKSFLKELETEAQTTRKMLANVPDEHYSWKPHPKSMTMKQLATHIAELPSWIGMTLKTDELDFSSSPYSPEEINATSSLLDYFERTLEDGRQDLLKGDESTLENTWTLKNGSEILSTGSKYDFLRMTFSQIIHHRAQLGVYLRLLNVRIPGSYGPSADEMEEWAAAGEQGVNSY